MGALKDRNQDVLEVATRLGLNVLYQVSIEPGKDMKIHEPLSIATNTCANPRRAGLVGIETWHVLSKKACAASNTGGLGGAQPPNGQTQCSHDGFIWCWKQA